jgi:hypothetical protein
MNRIVHKLPITEDFDHIKKLIFGISSHENDYRICWAINHQCGLSLAKSVDHIILPTKAQPEKSFPNYVFVNSLTRFRFIGNRCENGFLLEEYKNFDFILIIESPEDIDMESFIKNLKSSQLITAILSIDFNKLKNKNRLF